MKHKKVLAALLGTTIVVMCDFTPATAIFAEQIGSTKDTATTAIADGIAVNDVNFPDDNFRRYVSSNCDTNSDSVLSSYEIESVTGINISLMEIDNLKGIEYFTELNYLNCSWNSLTSLDVSKNTRLIYLSCAGNQLTELDVTQNTELTELYCNNNQLTSLDVTKNTVLETLYCYENQLTSLDVTKSTALTTLSCENNQLTELDVSKNTKLVILDCDSNQLTALDIKKNTELSYFDCNYNQLTVPISIDKTFDLSTLPSGFDVTKASNWTNATVNGNILTVKDLSLGSVTYTYNDGNSKFNDSTFELKVVIVGDVNNNGTVDAIDASIVLSAYAAQATTGKTGLTLIEEKAADVNSNGVVDAVDASTILSYYAYISTGGTASLNEFINM